MNLRISYCKKRNRLLQLVSMRSLLTGRAEPVNRLVNGKSGTNWCKMLNGSVICEPQIGRFEPLKTLKVATPVHTCQIAR